MSLEDTAAFCDNDSMIVRSDYPLPFGKTPFYFEIEVLESELEYPYVSNKSLNDYIS